MQMSEFSVSVQRMVMSELKGNPTWIVVEHAVIRLHYRSKCKISCCTRLIFAEPRDEAEASERPAERERQRVRRYCWSESERWRVVTLPLATRP